MSNVKDSAISNKPQNCIYWFFCELKRKHRSLIYLEFTFSNNVTIQSCFSTEKHFSVCYFSIKVILTPRRDAIKLKGPVMADMAFSQINLLRVTRFLDKNLLDQSTLTWADTTIFLWVRLFQCLTIIISIDGFKNIISILSISFLINFLS